jgi:hypothetical protein
MLIKVKMKASGACRTGSRHVKGRKGCWKKTGWGMGKKKR